MKLIPIRHRAHDVVFLDVVVSEVEALEHQADPVCQVDA